MATSICWNRIVAQPLTGKENYRDWSACIGTYLSLQDLWKVIEAEGPPTTEKKAKAAWKKKNLAALHAIQISCAPDILRLIRNETEARKAWDTLSDNFGPTFQDLYGLNWSYYNRDLNLLKAIKGGELDQVLERYTKEPRPNYGKIFTISNGGLGTALHQATISGNLNIVSKLVEAMSEAEILIRDHSHGTTALDMAASDGGIGKIAIAKCIIDKCKTSLTPQVQGIDIDIDIPLVLACEKGHKDMIYYLYDQSREFLLSGDDGTSQAALVIYYCIAGKMFDVALDLLRRRPETVDDTAQDLSPVLALARRSTAFLSGSKLPFWQLWIYSWLEVNLPPYSGEDVHISFYDRYQEEMKNTAKSSGLWSNLLKLSGIQQLYDLKLTHNYAREFLQLMSERITSLDPKKSRQGSVLEALSTAAELGVTEFIVKIIHDNPDLLGVAKIFNTAVEHRQEKVFSLIYGLGAVKDAVASSRYDDENTLLHLAGQLAPQRVLDGIPGAALQMQRELQWFQEVEGIVPHMYRISRNKNNKTPSEMFEESHKVLLEQGEKWMKDIAQSSTVVGALIITMMFAALYTVPGGNNQDGIPLFLQRKVFKLFIVSDAISLFASSTSVLMFLGLLTSRYGPKDFLKALPTKLIIALSTLFISIATMMIAFCSTVIIMVKGQLSYVIPIVLLASIPVSIFVWLQFPLLITVARSTYGPGIFDSKMKPWL